MILFSPHNASASLKKASAAWKVHRSFSFVDFIVGHISVLFSFLRSRVASPF